MNISIETTLYPQDPPEIVTVTFELIHPNAKAPTRATPGSAGWDVYACENKELGSDRVHQVSTGLRLSIPAGYEVQIRSRSSVAANGIIIPNAPATIDSDYRGELKVLMYKLPMESDDYGYWRGIRAGQRIAQLIIAPVPRVQFVQGVVTNNTERGEGGFGSTGK